MPDVSASWFFVDFFVATWYDRPNDCGVYARIFNQDGDADGDVIVVDPHVYGNQATCDADGSNNVIAPRVAAVPGGFVVVWGHPDGTLWMRTFDMTGTPLINAQQIVNNGTWKAHAVEVDATHADPCNTGSDVTYFTVTWWAMYTIFGTHYFYPQMLLFQNLSAPTPIIPSGSSYYDLDTSYPTVQLDDALWDRISAKFFDTLDNTSCTGLTIGFAWDTDDHVNNNYHKVLQSFWDFSGICSSQTTSVLGSTSSSSAPSSQRQPAPGRAVPESSEPGCSGGTCWGFTPAPIPSNEPQIIPPPAGVVGR